MNHSIDRFAYTNRLRWLPPGHKLAFAIVLLLLSLIAPPIVQGAIILWLMIWVLVYAHIPVSFYFKLLLIPLMFWLVSMPALVISGVSLANLPSVQFDIWPHWSIRTNDFYWYISQSGLHQGAVLLPRTIATTSSLYFMLLTTPFTEVLQVFRQLRCPELLLELLLLMYRFIFTILAIASEVGVAQTSRGGYRTWRRSLHSLGLLVGQLLERALHSYRQVSLSLTARGFNGELRFWRSQNYRSSQRYSLEAIVGCVSLMLISTFLFFKHA